MINATEIVGAGEDAIASIKLAIDELEISSRYNEIIKGLEDSITEIEYITEEYEEQARREYEEEMEYMNRAYERSVS